MYRHRTSRFRLLRPGANRPSRWLRLQQHGGLGLLILAGLVTTYLLVKAPDFYVGDLVENARRTFMNAHWADFEAVERHWKSLPILQSVKTGTEPDVRRFLEDQPLVVALHPYPGDWRLVEFPCHPVYHRSIGNGQRLAGFGCGA